MVKSGGTVIGGRLVCVLSKQRFIKSALMNVLSPHDFDRSTIPISFNCN